MKTDEILHSYFDSGYPAVAVESFEEKRLIAECKQRAFATRVFSISVVGGLIDEMKSNNSAIDASANFPKAFEYVSKQEESLLFVYDFQHVVSAPMSYRPLIRVLDACKARGTMVILVAPVWKLPEELKHMVPVVRMDLPSTEELEIPLTSVLRSTGKTLPQKQKQTLLSAARGLTLAQAEDVFALSSRQDFSHAIVEGEKMKLVRSDYMSVEQPKDETMLAGLGQLKAYIKEEILPSKDDIELAVRGILLVGVPGTGKSLSARVMAALMQWPLLRFDIAAAKGSLVGQSEANMRKALATADAIAPCVLWLDEVEKAVGGHSSSSHTDGGTTLAMVGTLLTWMQEHLSSVIVVATCNDFNKLPVELTRAGRFDERFFLDLPNRKEREDVATVHLNRLHCDKMLADSIAEMCEEWTPAEIEQLVKSAARRTGRQLTIQALDCCRNEIIPISKSTHIKELREWASTNLRKANDIVEAVPAVGSRRMHSGGKPN